MNTHAQKRNKVRKALNVFVYFGKVFAFLIFGWLIATTLINLAFPKQNNLPIEDREISIAKIKALETAYGININIGDPIDFVDSSGNTIFSQEFNHTAEKFNPKALSIITPAISNGLLFYPEGSFARSCKTIFLVKNMKFQGHRVGGTYEDDWVMISADYYEGNLKHTHNFIEKALHHEFSSFVWHDQVEARAFWGFTWPEGMTEAKDNIAALATGENPRPDPATGFLDAYALSNVENDFNTYAEFLFMKPEELKGYAIKYEVTRDKLATIIRAYEDYDPRFAQYFKDVGLRGVLLDNGYNLDDD